MNSSSTLTYSQIKKSIASALKDLTIDVESQKKIKGGSSINGKDWDPEHDFEEVGY